MNSSQRRGLVSGLIFTALGIMFLLEAFDMYALAPSTLWPVLLISLGIGVLAGIGDSEDDSADEETV